MPLAKNSDMLKSLPRVALTQMLFKVEKNCGYVCNIRYIGLFLKERYLARNIRI